MKPRFAALAGAVALALAAGGCADDRDVGAGDGSLTIYVSSPLHGPRAADGRAIADGARLALEQARGRAGEIRVRAVYLDDTEGGDWSIARTAANARRAAADVTTIGYVGELDSGATRVSLPITNQAGIAQVSPGSTAVDLTRVPPTGDASPERLRPSERQTFARVVPDDEVQAQAAAVWASLLSADRVGVVDDGSEFAAVLSSAFLDQAARSAVGTGEGGGSDLIYYAGEPAGFAEALRGLPPRPVISSDALITPAFLRSAALLADRLFLTSPFLAPSLLPAPGQRFLRAYRARFRRSAAPAAAYGYEAMALLLDAIGRAGDDGDDRAAVVDEIYATPERRTVLGNWAIDAHGDTTLGEVTGYRVADGLPVFPRLLKVPR